MNNVEHQSVSTEQLWNWWLLTGS